MSHDPQSASRKCPTRSSALASSRNAPNESWRAGRLLRISPKCESTSRPIPGPSQVRHRCAMDPLDLSPAERLHALRTLDVFHPWESIDEKRLCRRCGEIITGRQIQVRKNLRRGVPGRLECPTPVCPAVPFDWIVLHPPAAPETSANPLPSASLHSAPAPKRVARTVSRRPRLLGILRGFF